MVGPPGAGKTTLVASWLTQRKLSGIWYQVDGGDADLATFFYYLGLSAEPYRRKSQKPLPALTPEYLPDVEGYSRRFFRELFARLPAGGSVVLDNYQEVPAEQNFHQLIAQAIDELPEGITLIAVSRRDPPDCYARLIANENVGFIDWEELKLTKEEAKSISAKRSELSDQDFDALYHASEGWAAGLTLMLERLKRSGIAPERAQAETREGIFTYFANVIFERLAKEEQHVLLTTALLPNVSAQAAEDISGEPTAAALLEQFYRQRLFTDRRRTTGVSDQNTNNTGLLQNNYVAYQYHPLFREFLLARGKASFAADELKGLQQRTAQLLHSESRVDEAFKLLVEAGDWEAAVALTIEQAPILLGQGRWRVVLDWIETLPASIIDASSQLLYWRGMALIPADAPHARVHLLASLRLAEQANDNVGQLAAMVGIVASYFVRDDPVANYEPWIDPMARLLKEIHSWPNPAFELDARSVFLMSASFVRPRHPLVPPTSYQVMALLEHDNIDINTRYAAAVRALVYFIYNGEVSYGLRIKALFETWRALPQVLPVHVAIGYAFLGYFNHLCEGNTEKSLCSIETALKVARTNGLEYPESLALQFQAIFGAIFAENLDTSQQALDQLASQDITGNLNRAMNFHGARAHLRAWQGDATGARQDAETAIASARANCCMFLILCGVGLAKFLQPEAARDLLDEAEALMDGSCFENTRGAIHLERAAISSRSNDFKSCHQWLARALRAARSDQRQRAELRQTGNNLQRMLAEALRYNIEADFARELIATWKLPALADAPDSWPWPVHVRTLGEFEVRLLGQPLPLGRKTPRKTLAVLKALIALGAADKASVDESTLVDALWPDEDGDAALSAYTMALSRLRKLLGDAELLQRKGGRLILDRRKCWVDAWAFERALQDHAEGSSNHAIDLYRGSFLSEDSDESWTIATRERLRSHFLAIIAKQGSGLESRQRHVDAIALYQRGLDADPLSESFYQGLMRCHIALDQANVASGLYHRLRQLLSVSLAVRPAPETERLYQSSRNA